ncbi:MAG: TetR/AcrR family transcriptional regulator [Bacteroidales bacterium]|jgi:AcrR family transcriptional regulator|nr:TetR/AcrR family transcriptional regulator [Bacteroidales bacterium]
MVREDIIRKTAPLFAEYGIKGICMNEIVAELRISKRTLYEQFESKEELLLEVFSYETLRLGEDIEKIEREASSALEILVKISLSVSRLISSLCPALHKDIKHYPGILEFGETCLEQFEQKCLNCFMAAVKESDLEPRLNYEYIAALYAEQVLDMKRHTVTNMLLRGLATDNGREILDRLDINKQEITNKNN